MPSDFCDRGRLQAAAFFAGPFFSVAAVAFRAFVSNVTTLTVLLDGRHKCHRFFVLTMRQDFVLKLSPLIKFNFFPEASLRPLWSRLARWFSVQPPPDCSPPSIQLRAADWSACRPAGASDWPVDVIQRLRLQRVWSDIHLEPDGCPPADAASALSESSNRPADCASHPAQDGASRSRRVRKGQQQIIILRFFHLGRKILFNDFHSWAFLWLLFSPQCAQIKSTPAPFAASNLKTQVFTYCFRWVKTTGSTRPYRISSRYLQVLIARLCFCVFSIKHGLKKKWHQYDFFLKGSGLRKMRGVGSLATDRIWYGTVVTDVCLLFNGPVVFCATYFRFLLVKLN